MLKEERAQNAIPAVCAPPASRRQIFRIPRATLKKFGYDCAPANGTVAQLVEQGPFKALVLGSSPSRPTNKNNGLRWILSAKTVRTEICTETFIGFGFKSNRPTKFAIFAATAKPFLAVDRPLELIKPFFFSHREDPL